MKMNTEEIVSRFDKLSGRIDFLQQGLEAKEEQVNNNLLLKDRLNKALWVVTEVQKNTQQRFKEKIEGLVTMAIKSVYDRPFGFEIVFKKERDRLVCQPLIYEIVNGEKEYYDDAEDELGGGLADVCSIALRIVLWTMETPRSRPFFLLDEPGKNLGALLPLFGEILRKLSHELGIQFLIITHDEDLLLVADKSFLVTHDGRESHIEVLGKEELQQEEIKEMKLNTNPKKQRRKRK